MSKYSQEEVIYNIYSHLKDLWMHIPEEDADIADDILKVIDRVERLDLNDLTYKEKEELIESLAFNLGRCEQTIYEANGGEY